jgi:Uma2 family endonuclease
MSTIDRDRSATLPPLVDGERLDQATFHERYEAMPPRTRAELIGGIVYMPSPARYPHGDFVALLAAWVGNYSRGLVGVRAGCDSTTILDERSEVQPDVQLRIKPEYGGQTRLNAEQYVTGAPELAVEVAHASRKVDLGPKLAEYERTGVLEYLVVTLAPEEIHWFGRLDGRFAPMTSSPDGLFRSEVFPGLWLDPVALFAEDVDRLLTAVDRGRATPEHAAFAAELAARRT